MFPVVLHDIEFELECVVLLSKLLSRSIVNQQKTMTGHYRSTSWFRVLSAFIPHFVLIQERWRYLPSCVFDTCASFVIVQKRKGMCAY